MNISVNLSLSTLIFLNSKVTIQVTFFLKGGLMLAEKPMFNPGTAPAAGTANSHQFRKFASHYFTEFENDKVNEISSLARAPDSTANGAVDIREKNNWVDKVYYNLSCFQTPSNLSFLPLEL